MVLRIGPLTTLTDYFVICSAESGRQVQAIAQTVEDTFSKEGIEPLGTEGLESLSWVLIDYDDFIIHIFRTETRAFYDLERLWADAPRIAVQTISTTPAQVQSAGKGGVT